MPFARLIPTIRLAATASLFAIADSGVLGPGSARGSDAAEYAGSQAGSGAELQQTGVAFPQSHWTLHAT